MTRLGGTRTQGVRSDLLIACLLLTAVVAVYWPVRHFDYVRLDDNGYLFQNPHAIDGLTGSSIQWAFTSTMLGNYMPVALLSSLLDVSMWGLNPGPMHSENVLLHALNTVGWYLVWTQLTGLRVRSALLAGLFGLHPMHVETVAWIVERCDVLSMFFALLALLAYLGFVRTGRRGSYLASIGLYALAILSKPVAAVWPLVFVLIAVWPLGRLRWKWLVTPNDQTVVASSVSVRRFSLEITPYTLLAVTGLAAGVFARTGTRNIISLAHWSIQNRLANVVFGYSSYLIKLVWPEPMIVSYPLRTRFSVAAVVAAAGLLVLTTVIVLRRSRRKPYLLVGWVWFIGTLLPMVGFVQVGMTSIADRYTYLPYVGLSLIVIWWGADTWAAMTRRKPVLTRWAGLAAGVLVLSACATAARRQLFYWRNSFTLISHAYEVAPTDPMILNALGNEYRLAGRFDLALQAYDQCVAGNPDDADAQNNLAGVLFQFDPDRALPHYEKAVELAPGDAYLWWNLGVCQQKLSQSAKAFASYRQALQIDPNYEPAKASLRSLLPGV